MASNHSSEPEAFVKKVRDTIVAYGMIRAGDVVLAGVSGGMDSMCMLHVLLPLRAEMDFSVEVCHVNHLLRGRESDEDHVFVRSFCLENGLRFHETSVPVAAYAAQTGRGIEDAARILRYAFFEEAREGRDVRIAVAHHRRDQFETVLLNLMRGAGTAGLAGMHHVSGNRIRPLLDCTPDEISAYVEHHGIAYRTDSSNAEPVTVRNRIRRTLLPALQMTFGIDGIGPVTRSAELCRLDDDFIRQTADTLYDASATEQGFPCAVLSSTHPAVAARIIRKLMEQAKGDSRNLSMIQTRSVLGIAERRPARGRTDLPDGYAAITRGGFVRIVRRDVLPMDPESVVLSPRPAVEHPLVVPCDVVYEDLDCVVTAKRRPDCADAIVDGEDIVYNTKAWVLPSDALEGAAWRHRRPGDRFRPHPHSGSKTVKKFLNEAGIGPDQRDRLVLLAKGSDVLLILGIAAAYIPDGPGNVDDVVIYGRYRS